MDLEPLGVLFLATMNVGKTDTKVDFRTEKCMVWHEVFKLGS